MHNNEFERTATTVTSKSIQFHMDIGNRHHLEGLPWNFPLEEWPGHGVVPLSVRRGESRHPVIFVERDGRRYAIKETTPRMAEREIANLVLSHILYFTAYLLPGKISITFYRL